jgi:hypothetical protein
MLPPNKPKLASNWRPSLRWIFSFVYPQKKRKQTGKQYIHKWFMRQNDYEFCGHLETTTCKKQGGHSMKELQFAGVSECTNQAWNANSLANTR